MYEQYVLAIAIAAAAIFLFLVNILKSPSKENEMPVTNAIYDNTESDKLLDAKMKVLELAIARHSQDAGAEAVTKTARAFWDFIALKPDDDSDE